MTRNTKCQRTLVALGTVNHSVISAVYTLPPPGGVNIHLSLMDDICPGDEQVQWVLLEWFIFYDPIPIYVL